MRFEDCVMNAPEIILSSSLLELFSCFVMNAPEIHLYSSTENSLIKYIRFEFDKDSDIHLIEGVIDFANAKTPRKFVVSGVKAMHVAFADEAYAK